MGCEEIQILITKKKSFDHIADKRKYLRISILYALIGSCNKPDKQSVIKRSKSDLMYIVINFYSDTKSLSVLTGFK